jgi:hypothetical protein
VCDWAHGAGAGIGNQDDVNFNWVCNKAKLIASKSHAVND